jgi:iron(III) transport system permease protein
VRLRGAPPALLVASSLVALVLLAPLVFLVIEALRAGAGEVVSLLDRPLTAQLLWNTVRLTLAVGALCTVIGVGAAWLVERTDLPGGRIWSVLLVVPLAVPDFVVSFGWASLSPAVAGFRGSVLVMTLAVYPLVYLPVAANLRNSDPALEEVSRSLGRGPLRTFWRVTLGQARLAILGGCALVALVILAEYGAFEILGYQTFTTEIFTEFSVAFRVPTSSALSLVLVLAGLVVLAAEAFGRGRGRLARVDRMAQRATTRHGLGRWKFPALAGLSALVALSLGVPVASASYWWAAGAKGVLQGASLGNAAWHTGVYAACAAAVSSLMALPVAVLAVRHRGMISLVLERSTYLVLAMPGVVVALSLTYFSNNYANGLAYQTGPMLVAAYAIMFFPLALVGVRASVAQAPPRLEEVARSLGQRRAAVFFRVTLRLVAPGLAAAFSLVFLSAVTELTATLLLVPTGVQTLATQFWAYEQNLAYGQAAPFALFIILVAAVPSYMLNRFFDRLPATAGANAPASRASAEGPVHPPAPAAAGEGFAGAA